MNANAEIIAELRRVLNERDEAREQLDLTKRELGRWVDRETKAVRERDEARDRANTLAINCESYFQDSCRMRKERDEAIHRISEVGVMVATNGNLLAKDAYRRGAEAMREACADEVRSYTAWSEPPSLEFLERQVRALPIPEEP